MSNPIPIPEEIALSQRFAIRHKVYKDLWFRETYGSYTHHEASSEDRYHIRLFRSRLSAQRFLEKWQQGKFISDSDGAIYINRVITARNKHDYEIIPVAIILTDYAHS